jgi:DNA polymerase elongation subunit (family B)
MAFGEKGVMQLCFNGANKPRIGEVERFGSKEMTISLSGRNHLDYLAMFKKFTFEGRASFALGNIAEEELGITKLDHEGVSLRDLYRFEFRKFCTYNYADVFLLKKLNLKFKFVELVNQMAHENTVQFEAILGTTRYVDTGITNYAHNIMHIIVKDKETVSDHGKVEGAIVLTPNKGLHEMVGSVDINSLYPSVIRSLNMSPETFIGQFETQETFDYVQTISESVELIDKAKKVGFDLFQFFRAMSREYDFLGIWQKDNREHTARINGKYITKTGKEWNEYLREKKWVISAYGTIFDQSEKQGIVPRVLEFWYKERKTLQKQEKEWKKEVVRLKSLNVA